MGEELARAKASAPTRPHARSPDEPPFNLITSAIARPLDAIRDAGESVLKQVRKAAQPG